MTLLLVLGGWLVLSLLATLATAALCRAGALQDQARAARLVPAPRRPLELEPSPALL